MSEKLAASFYFLEIMSPPSDTPAAQAVFSRNYARETRARASEYR